ncbi:MAG TPA: cell division protein FtsA [bacterium]|nr:cell division protein FtsA [bacterium]HNT65594.1 cell division protein FtsA [bacterium]HOX86182.1 cell division protein FtsA [bacterium]HPG45604.1 cell division protein FtsA [bacterium]HPM97617.1 cell division protein FtsA [bacterium]
METSEIFAGLDIGTTKIGCYIAEVSVNREVKIIGVASVPSDGLRYGVVVDVDKTVRSIKLAIDEAKRMADVEIDTVFAGIAGDHIRSINGRGVVAISGEQGEVSSDDVRRVIDAAKAVALPIDREIIHILPQEFTVDDQHGIRDPVGMKGVRLEAEVHIVTGAIASAQNIHRCIEKAGYIVADLVLEPLASSYSVLKDDEKELGVILIDIGGGTSDIAMFYEGCIRHTSVVALGGRNVTNDLAIVLRTPVESAEKLKVEHGSALYGDDKDAVVEVAGVNGRPPRRISKGLLVDIIQPRMAEILTLTYEEAKTSDYINLMTTGVVLTGGASLLPGTIELAEDIFNMPAKLGTPSGFVGMIEEARKPQCATGVGLILYGLHHQSEAKHQYVSSESGMFDVIKKRFRRWFGSVTTFA